jgi:hypothetical protein
MPLTNPQSESRSGYYTSTDILSILFIRISSILYKVNLIPSYRIVQAEDAVLIVKLRFRFAFAIEISLLIYVDALGCLWSV